MDRRQDKDLTLADFKTWVERKFEDLEKKIVTDVQGATGQTDVSSAGVARWDLMAENPSSDYYDSQRESASAHGQFEKEASKPLKILEPGDPSIQQMLLEMLNEQKKMRCQISAVNDTLEKEKRFMRDELQNAQGDIIKRLENIKYQTTHFENRFHELAEKLENKVEETRTVTENPTSDCVGVMYQTVRDMTSKVVQEIKTVQAFVQQCQLSPNKQDLNIPDLKVLMGEVLKDFLHPIEKAVECSVKGQVAGNFVWLDAQILNHMGEIKVFIEEQKSQSTSVLNALKNSMHESQEKILQSETKLEQSVGDSEKRLQENLTTVIHQIQENQRQLEKLGSLAIKQEIKKLNIKLDGLFSKLTDQKAADTERSENCRKQILTTINEKCKDLEKSINNAQQELLESNQSTQENIKSQMIQSVTQMNRQIQKSENSVKTKQAQNLEDSEKRMVGNTNTVIARLEENLTQENQGQLEKLGSLAIKQEIKELNIKLDGLSSKLTDQNQGREDQLKTHVAEQIQTSKQSLEIKLSQNVRDSETRITGNITTVIARLEENLTKKNQGREDQLKTHVAEQIQTSKQSLEIKLSQNLRDSETRITGNIKTVTARLEENLTQQNQKSEKSLKDEMGKVKDETIQQIKQASNESCQRTKTEIQTNLKTNTETMKDFMTCVKRELFKFIEKESSITRIKITDPTTQVRSSTFDFYVKNFKDLVKSGKDVYSVPWYIDEFKSSVEGNVIFWPDGEIGVYLIYGRHYLEMGLKSRRVKLRVRATITDTSGVLPDLLVGEDTGDWNEEDVRDNRDCGTLLGTLKCQDVIQKGYDKCEGYRFDSVLVRYHIDVV